MFCCVRVRVCVCVCVFSQIVQTNGKVYMYFGSREMIFQLYFGNKKQLRLHGLSWGLYHSLIAAAALHSIQLQCFIVIFVDKFSWYIFQTCLVVIICKLCSVIVF